MKSPLISLLPLSFIIPIIASDVSKQLLAQPKVECGESALSLVFKTRAPFIGRIYVRGLADDERCFRSFADNLEQTTFSMVIQIGDCAMQKRRIKGSLEGVLFSLTVIVSFHSTFVTMADRAYRCMCFFRTIRRLNSAIDMVPISAVDLHSSIKVPSCSYTIHTESVDGPEVIYGRVGERIYHVWQCDKGAEGFFVHSCFVTDGHGKRFDLVDADGCPIDLAVQPNLEYDLKHNRVVAPTWGYKFSQTSTLNYQCVLEICKKMIGGCEKHIPPYCDDTDERHFQIAERKRTLREADFSSTAQMDLVASINIIENLKENKIFDHHTESFDDFFGFLSSMEPTSKTCLSHSMLILFLLAAFLLFGTLAALIILMVKKSK